MIEGAHFDVIISDVGMPHIDGYELMKRIRSRNTASGGDIPGIALTAFAQARDRQRALLAGFQQHIAKPVDPHELIASIASLVGLLRAREARRSPSDNA